MKYPKLYSEKGWMWNLTGLTFGALTALEPTEKRNRGDVVWRCKCNCGKETETTASKLIRGHTKSCGCLNAQILKELNPCIEGTNLRQALENKPESKRAVSGYTGISPKRGKWQASINYKKTHYHLGTFDNLEDAIEARALAKKWVMEDASKLVEKLNRENGRADVEVY